MSEPRESNELTDDERRDLKRRLEVVGAIVSEVQRLLYERDPFAEQVHELSARIRGKWTIALVALAILAVGVGREVSGFTWLESVGIGVLFLVGGLWLLPAVIGLLFAQCKLERLDARLREMRYRWLANGGNAVRFDDLKALHQARVGISLDGCEYERWWRAVRTEMQKKAMLLT